MTKRQVIISSICFALYSTLSLADVDNPPAPAQLTAEQIVQSNVVARGGLKAWRSIQTMSMMGVMDAGRLRAKVAPIGNEYLHKVKLNTNKSEQEGRVIQLPFAIELKRPLKMRVEVQFNGDTAVQVYDGTNGWKLRPFLGRREVESFTADEIKSASQQQQLDGFLIDYAAKGTKIVNEGAELVDGKYAYKLKLTLKDGQVRHTWVDAKSFLDVKIDGTRRMDGKPRSIMTYMRDYKSVNGMMVPFTLETMVDGVKDTEKMAIDKVTMNPQLADSQFTKPD